MPENDILSQTTNKFYYQNLLNLETCELRLHAAATAFDVH